VTNLWGYIIHGNYKLFIFFKYSHRDYRKPLGLTFNYKKSKCLILGPLGPKIIFLWRSYWTFFHVIVLGCHYLFYLFLTNFDGCNYIFLFWIKKKSIWFSLHLNFHVFLVLIVPLIFASFSWFFHPCNCLLYTSLNIFHIHHIHNDINLVIVCYILAHFKHIISKTNIFINLQKKSKVHYQ
jgi:hypothetical protein